MKTSSPLRYPGGKRQMYKTVESIIEQNNLIGCTYVEPYAGGASVALELLFSGKVNKIILNDFDRAIFCIWDCILNQTEDFINLIEKTSITIEEWNIQKKIYSNENSSNLELGFATFFLNRTNRSGIIKAGVIGGKNQNGNYLLDCRFNKTNLIDKIRKIADYKKQIKIFNLDAVKFLKKKFKENTFIFLDPPYYNKGSQLYKNHYIHNDHVKLEKTIKNLSLNTKWILTYDDVPEIIKIYKDYKPYHYLLNYFVEKKRLGNEVMFTSDNLTL